MSQTTINLIPESPTSIFNYGKWREGFLRDILIGASIFGFIALTANFLTGADTSDLITYSTAFVILLLTVLIPLPYWFKALVFLALEYVLAISGFLDTGLWRFTRFPTSIGYYGLSLIFTPCGHHFHNRGNSYYCAIRVVDPSFADPTHE